MKQQIKKLCKQLKRFDFGNILSILELPEDEVQTILQELISEKFISQLTKTEYAYVPNIITHSQVEILPKNQEIKAPKFELSFDTKILLAKHEDQQKNKSLTTKELLDEFEKIYLTPKRYSAKIA